MTGATPKQMVGSDDAGRDVEQSSPRMFPCDSCGADFEFKISDQRLECPFCGHAKELSKSEGAAVEENDLREAIDEQAARRSKAAAPMADAKEIRCGDCGATVQFHGTLISKECPYCGAPIQLDGVQDAEGRIAVDGVLPFKIDRKQAQTNLTAWVGSRWFAPGEFKKRGLQGNFNGVYMPYWTYDALTMNDYTGERGEYYYVTVRRGDKNVRERRTRWYPAQGSFRRFFDDVLVVAGRGIANKNVRSLEPWPLENCIPFNPQVMAGYLARTYDLPLREGFEVAEKRIASALHADVCNRIGGDTQRVHSIQTEYGALSYKHLLLPVWLMVYKYGDKAYQVVINAATGEVQGERPYSFLKIAVLVLAVLAVLVVVGFFAGYA